MFKGCSITASFYFHIVFEYRKFFLFFASVVWCVLYSECRVVYYNIIRIYTYACVSYLYLNLNFLDTGLCIVCNGYGKPSQCSPLRIWLFIGLGGLLNERLR